MYKFLLIISFIAFGVTAAAQKITPEEYIAMYKDAAIAEMQRVGIPASVTLAQGILETESGNSDLVKKSNNHFGIKCKSTWKGESVTHTDDAPDECFRKYPTALDSYKDHSDYLRNTPRYADLFKLAPGDYKGWAYGLRKAGYATNPKYPQIVISNIEKYNLQQYDQLGTVTDVAVNTKPIVTEQKAVVEMVEPVVTTSNIKPVTLPTSTTPVDLGNTKVNGLKVVFATKGMSLLAIATAANIDLQKLLDYNDLMNDGLLKADQLIYLERKAKQGNRDFYTVLQNERLYDAAQNNGVQLKMIAQYNGLNENDMIKKGTKIKLRPSSISN